MNAKKKTGKQLNSEPIIADSNCTKICVYMSLVLLASSLVYELTGFAYADVIGAAGLIYFSITEGKEAFEKVKVKLYRSCADARGIKEMKLVEGAELSIINKLKEIESKR